MNEPRDEEAALREQTEQARAELAQVREDVAEAENRLESLHAAELREANEHLVSAALRATEAVSDCEDKLKEAARMTEFDALTELPTRALLLDRLTSALANAKRHRSRAALLFVDLNNFSEINDTLGHATGDEALRLAARCFAASVREADTVSRHGGDEFLILLAEVSHGEDAVLVGQKIIASLGAPTRVGDHVLQLTASIGVSLYPDHGDDVATLIDRADAAMYVAKRHNLGVFVSGDEPRTG